MKRVKTFFVWLSASFCVAAMVAWGLGIAGWGFYYGPPQLAENDAVVCGTMSGLHFEWKNYPRATNVFHRETGLKIKYLGDGEGMFSPLIFTQILGMSIIDIPYWLLILLFALAPALRLRRRYVERRDKKLFEEIKQQKLAEKGKMEAE